MEERPVLQTAGPTFDPLSLCPPGSAMTSLQQYGDGAHLLQQSAMLFTITKIEEAITTEKHRVKYDRTRLILQETEGGMLTRCWVYGQHSRAVAKLAVKVGDLLLVVAVKKAIFAPKPGEEVLPNYSPWILHCGDQYGSRPSVTYIRREEDQNSEYPNAAQQEKNCLEVQEQRDVASVGARIVVEAPAPKNLSPVKRQDSPRSQYCRLADLKDTSARYNVFAVVSEVVEQPRGRKSKIVARVRLQDESMVVCGDLTNSFRFDILASSMEQIPELEVGAVLRIHNMRVEKWNGVFDGRVYSGSSVTSVLGHTGEPVKPMCYKQGPDMKWVEADNRKVEDLRRWWADKQTSKKTAETSISSLDAAETISLKCRVADLYSAPSGLVLRLEDGTQCNLRTVEFSGDFDTQTDEVGEESLFIDLWLDAEQSKQVREGEGVRQGCLVHVERLVPVNVGEEDDVVVRFLSGGIVRKLHGEEARGLATTIDERKTESQLNLTSMQAVIDMVDMDGTFVYESQKMPLAEESASNNTENQVTPSTTVSLSVYRACNKGLSHKAVPSLSSSMGPPAEKRNSLSEEDRTCDISLSPWDPTQSNGPKQALYNDMISLSSWNSEKVNLTLTKEKSGSPEAAPGVGNQYSNSVVPVADKQRETVGGVVDGVPSSLAAEEDVEEEINSEESAAFLDSQESQVVPFMALGAVIREKPISKRKTILTEAGEESNCAEEVEQSDLLKTQLSHGREAYEAEAESSHGLEEEKGCSQNDPGLRGLVPENNQSNIENMEEDDIPTTPCDESQFFTCPTANPLVADQSSFIGDNMSDIRGEPRRKRVRRSTECTNSSLDFGTALEIPELDISEIIAAAASSEVLEGAKCGSFSSKARSLAISCLPPARLQRVTTGQLSAAEPGTYRLMAVVVKAYLEDGDCSDPRVRLLVEDDHGEVTLVVKEEEVEKMCRDALVRQSLSLEEGLAQLEGKVADLGLEKINGSIFSVYSKMI